MSARDYREFHEQLPALAGRKCFLTLATNSVKLHIDQEKKHGTYLWIDPPWQFARGGELIASAESCPHHEEEDYEQRFQSWVSRFEAARASVISKIEASPDGSLRIHLSDQYALIVPKDFFTEDSPSWYDHWYFSKEVSNQQPEPTSPFGRRGSS